MAFRSSWTTASKTGRPPLQGEEETHAGQRDLIAVAPCRRLCAFTLSRPERAQRKKTRCALIFLPRSDLISPRRLSADRRTQQVAKKGNLQVKVRFLRTTAALALAALISACANSTSLPRVAAAQSPGDHSRFGAVHTLQDCGNDDRGFGAPGRHFCNPTPFSHIPFNWCWPQ